MSKAIVIAGTDTDVGKTLVSAGLMLCLPQAFYWKPVQAGTEPVTDTEAVQGLTGLPEERFLPEAYRLRMPASPHLSARMEDVTIAPSELALPQITAPLIVESAGGVMVPLTDNFLNIDLFARWGLPVILVARTSLGTINHSLLSIAALRARDIPIGGILFSGEAHEENEAIIPRLSGVWSLGRLPRLDSLDPARLHLAMQAHVDIGAIEALLA
jgi:dethiobiotin synthetase